MILNDQQLNDMLEKRDKPSIEKVADKTLLVLMSHFAVAETAWVQAHKTSVAWHKELSVQGLKRRSEVYVVANVKHDKGEWHEATIQLPFSVLMHILEQSRLTGDDKYSSQWIIGKKGSGLETEYTVVKGKSSEVAPETLEAKTKELEKFIEGKKTWLEKKYTELFVDVQKEEVINPEEIPF